VRAIIVLGPGVKFDSGYLKNALKLDDSEVKINAYPAKEGVAIFDCGKAVDLAWADHMPFVIGECSALGDRQKVTSIPAGEDAEAIISDQLQVLDESTPAEEGPDNGPQ